MSTIRKAWDEGRCAFGGWCVVPSPFSAELLAGAGFDYVCIDTQHGLIGYDAMVPMLQAAARSGVSMLVRVPSNDFAAIGKALDAGAEGVIVPLVNSPGEADAAAKACRYPPQGRRSFGPIRSVANPVCLVMIETSDAVAHARAICSTPGVDGVYIGPADLAVSLGVAPTMSPTDPKHVDAIATIAAACRDAGVVPGIHAGSGEQGLAHAANGMRMVTIATDSGLVQSGAARALAAARRGGAPEPTASAAPEV